MVENELKEEIRDIYRKALAEAIMYLWHNASAKEAESIEAVLKMSFEDLMNSINAIVIV